MIHLDLSKPPSLRLFVYLLALLPGIFFLTSVALGNPPLGKSAIQQISGIYPFPSYGLVLILLGVGFAIGEAVTILSWLIELVLIGVCRLPPAAFRKLFGGQRLYIFFGKYQGVPPKNTVIIRILWKLIQAARTQPPDTQEAKSVRFCLVAATEQLLKKRYGIGSARATGPNGLEWQVWFSVLGKPIRPLVEGRNLGRVLLATGIAGFLSIRFAPGLSDPYYLSLCALFAFAGVWSAFSIYFQFRHPVKANATRLRSVMLELQECSPIPPKSEAQLIQNPTQNDD